MSTIHLNRAGQNLGTFTLEEVQQGLDAGRFLGSDLGWQTGMDNWKPLSQWPDLTIAAAAPEPVSLSKGTGEFQPAPAGSGSDPVIYDDQAAKDGPPWEQRATLGFFPALAATVKGVLLEPALTFEKMKTEGGLGSPFLYYFFNSVVMVLISLAVQVGLQSLIGGMTSAGNASLSRELQSAGIGMAFAIPFALIALPIGLLISAFISSGLVHLSLMLLGGANKPYEATFRVWAYAQGSAAVAGLVPICGGLIAIVWYFVSATIGIAKVHGLSTGKAFLAVFLPVLVCCFCVGSIYAIIFFSIFASTQGHH